MPAKCERYRRDRGRGRVNILSRIIRAALQANATKTHSRDYAKRAHIMYYAHFNQVTFFPAPFGTKVALNAFG